jgi:hypothetical protein
LIDFRSAKPIPLEIKLVGGFTCPAPGGEACISGGNQRSIRRPVGFSHFHRRLALASTIARMNDVVSPGSRGRMASQ